MISIEEINKEITLHENNWQHYKIMDELKKQRTRVAFLKTCKYYLETDPTEDFVQGEIDKMRGSTIRCEGKLHEIVTKEQEKSLPDIVKNMRTKIKSNNTFLKTLLFIQNKDNGQNQGTLL